jgi:tetratricopeptide (TPR) repeat protein
MRSAPRKLGLALVALALVSSLARPSAADDVADEADLQFRLAARKYETADYQGALEHFLASNRLVPNKNVVFNIARTYEQLKQPADAYRYYQRALEGETDAGAQKRIQEALARIRPLVSVVRVVSSPPGATVYLDRKDLGARGQTPLVLAVPAGKYTFLGELAGHESGKAEAVELRQGSETEVRIPLVPIYGTLVLGGEAGAEVRDGVDATSVLCTIPCSVKVPVGKHVLRITKTGFEPFPAVREPFVTV